MSDRGLRPVAGVPGCELRNSNCFGEARLRERASAYIPQRGEPDVYRHRLCEFHGDPRLGYRVVEEEHSGGV